MIEKNEMKPIVKALLRIAHDSNWGPGDHFGGWGFVNLERDFKNPENLNPFLEEIYNVLCGNRADIIICNLLSGERKLCITVEFQAMLAELGLPRIMVGPVRGLNEVLSQICHFDYVHCRDFSVGISKEFDDFISKIDDNDELDSSTKELLKQIHAKCNEIKLAPAKHEYINLETPEGLIAHDRKTNRKRFRELCKNLKTIAEKFTTTKTTGLLWGCVERAQTLWGIERPLCLSTLEGLHNLSENLSQPNDLLAIAEFMRTYSYISTLSPRQRKRNRDWLFISEFSTLYNKLLPFIDPKVFLPPLLWDDPEHTIDIYYDSEGAGTHTTIHPSLSFIALFNSLPLSERGEPPKSCELLGEGMMFFKASPDKLCINAGEDTRGIVIEKHCDGSIKISNNVFTDLSIARDRDNNVTSERYLQLMLHKLEEALIPALVGAYDLDDHWIHEKPSSMASSTFTPDQ